MATNVEARGRFAWFDLMTTDVEGAKRFYTALVGWKVETWEGAGEPYTMWIGPRGPIGGVGALPEDAKEMGAPPHWLAHVIVPDLEKVVGMTKERGGEVLLSRMEIPTVGAFSILKDPQGAIFAAYTAEGEPPGHDDTGQVGEVSWHELATTNHGAALQFYGDVFGWNATGTMELGPEMGGVYQMFGRGAATLGGIFDKPAQMQGPPMWLYYFRVTDLDAALAKTQELGGKVLNGPMEVPGGGHVAQCMDPQGAMFALHATK